MAVWDPEITTENLLRQNIKYFLGTRIPGYTNIAKSDIIIIYPRITKTKDLKWMENIGVGAWNSWLMRKNMLGTKMVLRMQKRSPPSGERKRALEILRYLIHV